MASGRFVATPTCKTRDGGWGLRKGTQSGNILLQTPGGPVLIRKADALAREYTEQAISKLAEIMENGEDRDSISACKELLDRGHGKPLTATIALPINRQQAALLAQMSDDELEQSVVGTQLPRLVPAETIDHDPLLD